MSALNVCQLCCICGFISVLVIRVISLSNIIAWLNRISVDFWWEYMLVRTFWVGLLIGFDQLVIHLSINQERRKSLRACGVCLGCFVS